MTLAWIDLGTDAVAMHVWFWITALLPLVWLKRHIDISRGRDEPILSDAEAQPRPDDPPLPPLSMLVAGKDEEANIGVCIEGLLAQRHPALQVIAVNDRSSDRTGEILDAFAAADPRITALHVRELPAGWFGKNNAMRTGVAAARADWLAFTDADCRFYSPHLLEAALRFAMRNGVEFLSVLPRIDAGSFWERVVQPAASGMMLFWNPPHRVNSAKSSCAYANGAFMLMTRDAYGRLGGHEAVKATLNEDMHLRPAGQASGGAAAGDSRGGSVQRADVHRVGADLARLEPHLFWQLRDISAAAGVRAGADRGEHVALHHFDRVAADGCGGGAVGGGRAGGDRGATECAVAVLSDLRGSGGLGIDVCHWHYVGYGDGDERDDEAGGADKDGLARDGLSGRVIACC
ncbi:MAG: glycosyltransferase [Phycisphaerales bacterium]|nr:glycosyltransferase [Phycisphaerales bacterium]